MPKQSCSVVCSIVAALLLLAPGWAGSLGAGMALTSGNSDTSSANLAYELLHDSGDPLVFKSTGLYLRGESEGEATVERAAAEARLDYWLTPRLSGFGLTSFAHDRFKDIEYFVAPYRQDPTLKSGDQSVVLAIVYKF